MAESIGSKGGNVNIISIESLSTTVAITEGAIIELDSSGYAQACATDEGIKTVGVCTVGKPGTTNAERRFISIQTNGMVILNGWDDSTSGHQTSIVPGERVMVGKDSDSSWTVQVVVHAAAAGATTSDFNTDGRKPIGIAMGTVSTAGTRYAIKVLLTL